MQIPGRVEWGEITLKRGLTTNIEFWDWREMVVTGDVASARVDCTITMFDREYALGRHVEHHQCVAVQDLGPPDRGGQQ